MEKNTYYTKILMVLAISLIGFLTGNAQNPFPETPPKDVNFTMDRDQMLWQLGIELPDLVPKLEDKNAPPFHYPADESNPQGNWRDSIGHLVTRSTFGIWNNYDQDDVGTYTPIDLLEMVDGSKVSTTDDWWNKRRPEIFDYVKSEMWGAIPEEADNIGVDFEVVVSHGGVGNNAYIQKQITGTIDVSSYPDVRDRPIVSAVLRLPANATKATPVMIVFGGVNGLDGYWNRTAPNGWGVCMFNPNAIQPDNGSALTSYLIGLVNKGHWRKPNDWGSLVAWSWGIGKLIDYFETDKDVDEKAIGVSGHSRYGKGTIVAAAYEPRIAVAYPSCGGALGPSMIRRHWGQDLENCGWDREYHWMSGNFFKFMGPLNEGEYKPRKVENLHVDAHSLLSLIAPRPVFLNGGTQDTWTDFYGTFLTAQGASPVYKLLGKEGLVAGDAIPVEDKAYIDGNIGYRYHIGGHTDAPDWPAFFDFTRKYFNAPVLEVDQEVVRLGAKKDRMLALSLNSNSLIKSTTSVDWLSVTISSDGKSLDVVAKKNKKKSGRKGEIVIMNEGKSISILVVQEGKKSGVEIMESVIETAGTANQDAFLGIRSKTAWTVMSSESWLRSEPAAGVNEDVISLIAVNNPTVTPREAELVVESKGYTKTIKVMQKAGPATLNVFTNEIGIGKEEGSSSNFFATSNTTIMAKSNVDWLKVEVTGNGGFKRVVLTAKENKSGASRKTDLSVYVDGLDSETVVVTQE